MALVNCPECKKEIIDPTVFCPHCGVKLENNENNENNEKKAIIIGSNSVPTGPFGKICIIILIISGIGFMYNSIKSSGTGGNYKKEVTVSDPNITNGTIGQSVEVGCFVYKVEAISFRKYVGTQFYSVNTEGVFLLVKLTVSNICNQNVILDNSLFSLVDNAGSNYAFSPEGSSALEMGGVNTLFLKSCNPNVKKTGYLIFEVPSKDTYSLKLMSGNKLGYILLNSETNS